MPLYQRKCDSCGKTFEVYRSVARREPVACECGGSSCLLPATFHVGAAPAPVAVGGGSKTSRPRYQKRAGGGMAFGGRPMVTHHTRCPKGHDANVAILGKLPEGLRVNCERCGYQWIYQAKTAAYPLVPGTKSSLRRPLRFTAGVDRRPETGYTAPEGA